MPIPWTRTLLVVASLFGCGMTVAAEQPPSAAQMMDDLMYGRGSVGGPFTLTDQNGKPRSDTDFRGKLMIVYFGYTYCPDVCPADLMAITQALDALGPAAEEVQPIVHHDRSGAGHGAAGQICLGLPSKPDRSYRFSRRNPQSGQCLQGVLREGAGPAQWRLCRSTTRGAIYLMGRNGEYLGFMPPQTAPDRLIRILRDHLAK